MDFVEIRRLFEARSAEIKASNAESATRKVLAEATLSHREVQRIRKAESTLRFKETMQEFSDWAKQNSYPLTGICFIDYVPEISMPSIGISKWARKEAFKDSRLSLSQLTRQPKCVIVKVQEDGSAEPQTSPVNGFAVVSARKEGHLARVCLTDSGIYPNNDMAATFSPVNPYFYNEAIAVTIDGDIVMTTSTIGKIRTDELLHNGDSQVQIVNMAHLAVANYCIAKGMIPEK